MEARYVRWLLPMLLLAAFRPQAPAQTKATGDTVVLSDTARWTWEATAGEEKHFSFTVDMPGYYRICWGDGDTSTYRIRVAQKVNHQYQRSGSYEVKMFGFAPLAAGDTIPYYILDTAFGIRMEMVYVEGGTFAMGCTEEQGSDCSDDESPSHNVTLDGFYIGKFEVTQGQWKAVMGSNPSSFKNGDDYPVENVSWDDAVAFCDSLSKRTGRKYRLPTEAEWEYAARGGQNADGIKYAGSNTVGDVAWYGGNSGDETHPVGQKQPNGLGLYDMSGNVWEWCYDWYGSYSGSSVINPQGPTSGSYRVYRGGSWNYLARSCRVSNRDYGLPADRFGSLGFRVAVLL